MNRSYTENDQFISNNGIYSRLYESAGVKQETVLSWLHALLFRLLTLVEILTGATAVRLYKVTGVVLSLIGMIGIAGAIETGKLSIAAGLGICALLLCIEYLCLRPQKKKG